MLIKDEIIEMLKEDDLTVNEIYHNKPELTTKKTLRNTLSRMKKKGLIIVKGYKESLSIYALNPDKFQNGKNTKELRETLMIYDKLFAKNRKLLFSVQENKDYIKKNRDTFVFAKNQIEELKKGDND